MSTPNEGEKIVTSDPVATSEPKSEVVTSDSGATSEPKPEVVSDAEMVSDSEPGKVSAVAKVSLVMSDAESDIDAKEEVEEIEELCVLDPEAIDIDLNHGKIAKIENLESLTCVETLCLRWNLIKKIENLSTLTTLRELELYDNQVIHQFCFTCGAGREQVTHGSSMILLFYYLTLQQNRVLVTSLCMQLHLTCLARNLGRI